jgi:hypothetical protein
MIKKIKDKILLHRVDKAMGKREYEKAAGLMGVPNTTKYTNKQFINMILTEYMHLVNRTLK